MVPPRRSGTAAARARSNDDPPAWMAPMLATLTSDRFSDPAWLFERKLDGERALAFRGRSGVRLLSRNKLDLNGSYPEVVEALTGQKAPGFVLDGEVVAFDRGRTSFAKLQQRMGVRDPSVALARGVPVVYYVFDMVWFDGEDIRERPLRDRKLRRDKRPTDVVREIPAGGSPSA